MAEEKNQYVGIGASLGGIYLVIVIMFLIFARDQLAILVPLVWAFVVLGGVIAFFATISHKKK